MRLFPTLQGPVLRISTLECPRRRKRQFKTANVETPSLITPRWGGILVQDYLCAVVNDTDGWKPREWEVFVPGTLRLQPVGSAKGLF